MPKGQPAEAIVVPHPEPYVRKKGRTVSPRVEALFSGQAVFLPNYRRPGYYRTLAEQRGYTLSQRQQHDAEGNPTGVTVWINELRPE